MQVTLEPKLIRERHLSAGLPVAMSVRPRPEGEYVPDDLEYSAYEVEYWIEHHGMQSLGMMFVRGRRQRPMISPGRWVL